MTPTVSTSDREWAENARSLFPHVTSYGYGLPQPSLDDNWGETLSDEDVFQIISARDFLKTFRINKSVNRNSPTSVMLKNLLMGLEGVYVYKGAITLSALALGIPVGGPSCNLPGIGVNRQDYRTMQTLVTMKNTRLDTLDLKKFND